MNKNKKRVGFDDERLGLARDDRALRALAEIEFPHFAHFPRKTTRDYPPRWNVRFPVNVRSCHLMGTLEKPLVMFVASRLAFGGEKFRSKFNFSSENAIGFEKELLITWGNGTGRRGSDLKLIVGKWKFEADGEGWNVGSQPLLTCSSTTNWRSNPNKSSLTWAMGARGVRRVCRNSQWCKKGISIHNESQSLWHRSVSFNRDYV